MDMVCCGPKESIIFYTFAIAILLPVRNLGCKRPLTINKSLVSFVNYFNA